MRLKDDIILLRDKLNRLIEEEVSYDIIYDISVELDQLIAQFYKINK